ncbi:MAG: hypothetical protein E7266_08350 [Lachnospiraceae bacterium]|nr:hypothetical protein [Lachnospiraceae bacterium]
MEGQNILYGNLNDLKGIREEVKALEDVKKKVDEFSLSVQKLQKEIKSEEKLLADTIDSTIKKRREQVASNYDKELKKEQDRLKKVRDNRDKAKAKGVKARISLETAELVQENKNLKEEIKTNLKHKKVSGLFNSDFLYSLYFPQRFRDYFDIVLLALFFVVAAPFALVYLALDLHVVFEVLIFIVTAAIVPGIYVLGFLYARGKHKEDLLEKNEQRLKIRANIKSIKRIEKNIRKDKNEDSYDLGGYDDDIETIEKSIEDIVSKKKAAMSEFESVTKGEISEEITERETPRIESTKKKFNEAQLQLKSYEDVQKDMSMKITSKYSAYLGNENMSTAKIDKLLDIMKEGTAKTIGDAVNIAKEMR